MDHDVEDDVRVYAAAGERRQPVALDEARPVDQLASLLEDGIETLEMPHLENDSRTLGGIGQALGRRRVGSERLLDQHVHAGGSRLHADLCVRERGNRNAHDVDGCE